MVFLMRKNDCFSKSVKVANFLCNAYQTIVFLKNVFSTLIVFFWKKIRNFSTLENLENI